MHVSLPIYNNWSLFLVLVNGHDLSLISNLMFEVLWYVGSIIVLIFSRYLYEYKAQHTNLTTYMIETNRFMDIVKRQWYILHKLNQLISVILFSRQQLYPLHLSMFFRINNNRINRISQPYPHIWRNRWTDSTSN